MTTVRLSGEKLRSRLPNLQFAFHMYAKAMSLAYSLPKHENGWDKFKTSIMIRDRLTHPKVPLDLEVSKDNVVTVLTGFKWIQDCQKQLFSEVLKDVEDSQPQRRATKRTKPRTS